MTRTSLVSFSYSISIVHFIHIVFYNDYFLSQQNFYALMLFFGKYEKLSNFSKKYTVHNSLYLIVNVTIYVHIYVLKAFLSVSFNLKNESLCEEFLKSELIL